MFSFIATHPRNWARGPWVLLLKAYKVQFDGYWWPSSAVPSSAALWCWFNTHQNHEHFCPRPLVLTFLAVHPAWSFPDPQGSSLWKGSGVSIPRKAGPKWVHLFPDPRTAASPTGGKLCGCFWCRIFLILYSSTFLHPTTPWQEVQALFPGKKGQDQEK